MKVRGTVEFRDIEMGVWVLAGDDGKTYQLAGGRSSLLKEGQRVEVDGDVDSGAMGVAMVGPVLRVHGYKVV
jgi:cob(I)alamin adenosyltransferase